jgi:hypothetical protein
LEILMSFPSAITRLEAGDGPKAALLYAFKHDTALGFKAIRAVAEAARTESECCPLCSVKAALGEEYKKDVLRCEPIGEGIAVDFDPLSKTGLEIARLLGTDAARPLIEEEIGMPLGYANCCKVIASARHADVEVTVLQQIEWQSSIDC